ncbi:MAG: type II secretion system protein GspC [Pseudomonadota bacterium]
MRTFFGTPFAVQWPVRWVQFLERYRTITNVVGTVLVGWILSLIVSQIIGLLLAGQGTAPLPPRTAPALLQNGDDLLAQEKKLAFYMPVCDRNIFDSKKRAVCEAEAPEGSETGAPLDLNAAPIKSDLAATLLGTMVSTNPNYSFATIQAKGSQGADPYYIDQVLMSEAKIYDVQRNKVYFIRNGHREYLEVENLPNIYMSAPSLGGAEPSGAGVRLEGDKAIVARSKVDATLGDLNQVIQQARMVPNFKGGAVDGFKIFAIRPGSIFSELGLQNGDVVERINGTEINSVEKAIPMLQLARNENTITIDLTRNGVKKSLSIEIR